MDSSSTRSHLEKEMALFVWIKTFSRFLQEDDMKKWKPVTRRMLSLLLVMAMTFSLLPTTVFATEVETPEEQSQTAPTSISISLKENDRIFESNGSYYLYGDENTTFQAIALDQDGNETPVTWTTTTSSTYISELNEQTGEFKLNEIAYGSTGYVYLTATSTLDTGVSQKICVYAKGYKLNTSTSTTALSTDGQTAKSISFSAGIEGYNVWTYNEEDWAGIAELVSGLNSSVTVKFTALRPGTFTVGLAIQGHDDMTQEITVKVTGVAVETEDGESGQIYLQVGEDLENPTVQLKAYLEEDKTLASWTSSNENAVTVDENGKITAVGVGTAYIYAKDSSGTQGGIKVVVRSADTPYLDALNFSTTTNWAKVCTFDPLTLSYTGITLSSYSYSSVSLAATTLYDTDSYTAVAQYTDINGEEQEVSINSGSTTTLTNIPFGTTTIYVLVTDKKDATNTTTYTFEITRPRDASQYIRSTSGIVLVPNGRTTSAALYEGKAEGTMFRTDAEGNATGSYSVTTTCYYYCTYLYGQRDFYLKLSGSTAYSHLRYSIDDGETWTEVENGYSLSDSYNTEKISIPEEDESIKVLVQVLSDSSYATYGGFEGASPTQYTLWVIYADIDTTTARILTAETDDGTWYNAFDSETTSYKIYVANGVTSANLTFTIKEGNTVALGSKALTADENGNYTVALSTTAQTINVTGENGYVLSYSFQLIQRVAGAPDAVVDYLSIGSQYTSVANYAMYPESTLTSSALLSLGGFGGYITYYYEDAITDDPYNLYGVDFYIYGNAFLTNGSTQPSAEPGQVWVSEDGETWYALAGSEYYEDTTITDYEITYTKMANGNTSWTDNYGNSSSSSSESYSTWPNALIYNLCSFLTEETTSITLSGILLKTADGDIANANGSTSALVGATSFGYVDAAVTDSTRSDVNPYEATTGANGFDLAWAVDADGEPVTFENGIHYIKVVTCSNLWAGACNEKSTEISGIIRTTPQTEKVGVTEAPEAIVVSDGTNSLTIELNDEDQIYDLNVGTMKYVSISLEGMAEDDNVYINNQKVAYGESAEGIKVTTEDGTVLVRVIVQNGEKTPVIYLLRLTGTASGVNDLVENVSVQVYGSATAVSQVADEYSATVSYNVNSVQINVTAQDGSMVTINGKEIAESYDIVEGENLFTIIATKGEITHEVTLMITREATPEDTGHITVTFTLLGDTTGDNHNVTHTYDAYDEGDMLVWIDSMTVSVPSYAKVLDVFEAALTEAGISWVNDGGNYISTINGLSEFDNGINSGWMYLINNVFADYGVAEQEIQDGDVIVFFYTDDYTLENYDREATDPLTITHEGSYVVSNEGHKSVCSCGYESSEIEEHVYGEWTVLVEATNEKDGLQTRTCQVCGYVQEEVILAGSTTPDAEEPKSQEESATATEKFVSHLYEAVLGRTPDACGNDWVKSLDQNVKTAAEVVAGFVQSTEYQNKKCSNAQYVTMLYAALLNRTPSASEVSGWVELLEAGLTRDYVLSGFTNSTEFQKVCRSYGITRGTYISDNVLDQNPQATLFVSRLYEKALGRTYDEAGLIDWVSQILAGTKTASQVVEGFFLSQEFMAKNVTNEKFVTLCYQAIFDRDPDANGYQDWLSRLSAGASRTQIIQGMTGADEFARMCATYGMTK